MTHRPASLTLTLALALAATACTTAESTPATTTPTATVATPPPVIDRSAEAEELCHAAVRDEIPHVVASAVTLEERGEPANGRYVVNGQFFVMGDPDMYVYDYDCIAYAGKNDTLIVWKLDIEEVAR